MSREKILGLLYILLGLLLIICPVFSSELLSISIGFALACLGVMALSKGFVFKEEFGNAYSYLSIAIGIVSLLFGILFIFSLNALTFLTSLQFYIIGIIMAVYGFVGMFCLDGGKNKLYSIIILILGILIIVFAAFLSSQPILIAVLVGVALLVEGVFLIIVGRSKTLIEKYG